MAAGSTVTVPSWLVAALVAIGMVAVMVRLLAGGRLRPLAEGSDADPLARAPYGAELAVAVFAVARIATEPAARPAAFGLLGLATILPPLVGTGPAARRVGSAIVALIGAVAAVTAFGGLVHGPCADRIGLATIALAVGCLLVTVALFAVRLLMSGWLGSAPGVGAAAVGVFALAELAPTALAPDGVALLGAATPWWARAALAGLLVVVAVGVGLRPRFAAGVIAVALTLVTLGLIAAPTPCGPQLGWVVAAGGLVLIGRGLIAATRRARP